MSKTKRYLRVDNSGKMTARSFGKHNGFKNPKNPPFKRIRPGRVVA